MTALAAALPLPSEKRIKRKLTVGRLQRLFTRPGVFTYSAFPILWVAALFDANPDVYLWEKIRQLDPLPDDYTERFANVQAAIALAGLEALDKWTAATRTHARVMDDALKGLAGVQTRSSGCLISCSSEARVLRDYDDRVLNIINVDDFAPQELGVGADAAS